MMMVIIIIKTSEGHSKLETLCKKVTFLSAKAIPAVTGVNHDHVTLIVTFGQCAPQSLDVQKENDLEISKVIIFYLIRVKDPRSNLL